MSGFSQRNEPYTPARKVMGDIIQVARQRGTQTQPNLEKEVTRKIM